MQRQGVDPDTTSLRIGIFGAEPWTGRMREDIEQRTGIDAVDIYGLSEVMGPGVAMECVESKDGPVVRSEEHTSELQSLMRISYAVFCLKKKNKQNTNTYMNI